jgi:hypothetical protein
MIDAIAYRGTNSQEVWRRIVRHILVSLGMESLWRRDLRLLPASSQPLNQGQGPEKGAWRWSKSAIESGGTCPPIRGQIYRQSWLWRTFRPNIASFADQQNHGRFQLQESIE